VRVLIVEDARNLAQALASALMAEHYDVVIAATGEDGFFRANAEAFDLVVLDVMLPGRSGLEILQTLRQRHIDTPVLILTARDGVDDRVLGLDLGADDYLVKPYDARELIARILAVHRRVASGARGARPPAPADDVRVLDVGGVRIDLGRREVTVADRPVALTRKELALLEVLAEHPGLVVRRERLLSRVWRSAHEFDAHTLDVHVAAVRSKTGVRGLIETVRGVGYRLGTG